MPSLASAHRTPDDGPSYGQCLLMRPVEGKAPAMPASTCHAEESGGLAQKLTFHACLAATASPGKLAYCPRRPRSRIEPSDSRR